MRLVGVLVVVWLSADAATHGALRLLPLYTNAAVPPIVLKGDAVWTQALRASGQNTKQEVAHQATPATWEEIKEAVRLEPVQSIRMALLIAWLTRARGGVSPQWGKINRRPAQEGPGTSSRVSSRSLSPQGGRRCQDGQCPEAHHRAGDRRGVLTYSQQMGATKLRGPSLVPTHYACRSLAAFLLRRRLRLHHLFISLSFYLSFFIAFYIICSIFRCFVLFFLVCEGTTNARAQRAYSERALRNTHLLDSLDLLSSEK